MTMPLASPTRQLPRSLKPATINRMDAINRGLARKHPKLSQSAAKLYSKGRQFCTPSDKDIYLATRYKRTLAHFE